MRDGRLRPGTRLPSTRALAAALGISRGLVVNAYGQLAAEGYLRLRQGSAPTVAQTFSRRRARLTEKPTHASAINLLPDLPDFGAFPRDEWLRSYRAALKRAPDAALGYGDARGSETLRSVLADYLGRVRGVAAVPEQTLACGGFAQAIGVVCNVLRKTGRGVLAVEDPGHAAIRTVVERTGIETVPIRVDEDGLDVAALEASRAKAVLVTPAHQFPTGVVLAPDRRAALIEWSQREGGVIVEDDYDAEYRYDRAPVGALQGLAPDRVFYLGSASKTLAPTLRLGWIVAPAQFAREAAAEILFTILAPPRLEQLALADFVERGELDRHLRRMRLRYRRRRDVVVRALARELPMVEVRGIAAGLHVLAVFPEDYDEQRMLREARARRIGVHGLRHHSVRTRGRPALLVGYGALGEAALRRAVKELAAAVAASR